MMQAKHSQTDRGRIGYVDVILSFGVLVSFAAVAPWFYQLLDMGGAELDAFSGVLLRLLMPLLLIVLLLSMGRSAQS